MKTRFFIFLLMISLLFAACGGSAPEQEASITMNAGKVARYLGRSISREGQNGFSADDLMAYTYYGMRIEVYTEGSVKSSDKKEFKKSMAECDTYEKIMLALEEFYTEAGKAELTLKNIPVGSKITVHAKLSVGEMIDEEAYKEVMLATGVPESFINEMIAQMQERLTESLQSIEGTSDEIKVKSGPNSVKIRIKAPLELNIPDDDSFDIILYTNVYGGNNNAFWSYKMETSRFDAAYTRNKRLDDLDEDAGDIIDFMVDSNGGIYYSYMYQNSDLCVDYVQPDPGISTDNVCYGMDISGRESSKIYVDEDGKVVFFGSVNDNGYEIAAHPIDRGVDISYESDNFSFEEQAGVSYTYSDFAIALGEENVYSDPYDPEDPESEIYNTYTYPDSAVYLAAMEMKVQGDGGGGTLKDYDIIISKIPMTYTIEEREAWVESIVSLADAATSIKLSQAGIVFPYGRYCDYPYSVSDMIIQNDKLYILIVGNRVSTYDIVPPEYPYYYTVISNGAMIVIDLSDFTATGVSSIGYDPSLVTFISLPLAGDNTKEVVFNVMQPESEKDLYFFSPRKFVAITPKKLVIADDGTYYYKDGNDFYYKNVDRLVVYDEDSPVLQTYTLDTQDVIKFEKYEREEIDFVISGSGFSDVNAARCSNNE